MAPTPRERFIALLDRLPAEHLPVLLDRARYRDEHRRELYCSTAVGRRRVTAELDRLFPFKV